MDERFSRTELMLGGEVLNRLKNANVAVFGVGGVGGYVVEILARAGISNLAIFDNDRVDITNINRQIIATTSTIGMYKVDAVKNRILDINPDAKVETFKCFYLPENADEYDLSKYDYVIDCIDTVAAKVELAKRCENLKVPIIASMGSRNRLDYTKFKICDIFDTHYDKLAKIMRKKLRENGVKHLKVAYSEEDSSEFYKIEKQNGLFVESTVIGPSIMGVIIGSEVVKSIAFKKCKVKKLGENE